MNLFPWWGQRLFHADAQGYGMVLVGKGTPCYCTKKRNGEQREQVRESKERVARETLPFPLYPSCNRHVLGAYKILDTMKSKENTIQLSKSLESVGI